MEIGDVYTSFLIYSSSNCRPDAFNLSVPSQALNEQPLHSFFISDEGLKEVGSFLQQWSMDSHIGMYINCSVVNTSGSYVHLEIIESDSKKQDVKYEMELPHRYIKLIITGSDIAKIGFLSK